MLTALAVVGTLTWGGSSSTAATAGPWVASYDKSWIVGVDPLIIEESDYYAMQSDGDGLRLNSVRFWVTRNCGLLERSGGYLTGIHVYIQQLAWPHLPVADKALANQYVCDAQKAVGLNGPDAGGMRVQINAHVRIDAWDDKDPVWAHNDCRDPGTC